MKRVSGALWLLVALLVVGGNYYAHRHAQKQRRPCPPECARCGGPWALSSKSWCVLKPSNLTAVPNQGEKHAE